MATYKQRTPYLRLNSAHSPEQDSIVTQTAASTKHVVESISSSSTHPVDDILLDNTLDQEWMSIRQQTASSVARARARQQQYLYHEQQRAQEWDFVLGHHQQRSSLTKAAPISVCSSSSSNSSSSSTGVMVQDTALSSDEGDHAVLSSTGKGRKIMSLRLHETSNRDRARASSIGTSSYSELTSEGFYSLEGESEDYSIWSQDDDDQHSSTKSTAPRFTTLYLTSGRLPYAASSSSTTSLNSVVHASFGQHIAGIGDRSHSQLLFHDGSGNFGTNVALTSPSSASAVGSDHESEWNAGWESSSSSTSLNPKYLRQQEQRQRGYPSDRQLRKSISRGPISSSEFDTVINNIALLQSRHTEPSHQHRHHHHQQQRNPAQSTSSHQRRVLSTPSHFNGTIHVRKSLVSSKLSSYSIYESDMEDIDAMVIDIPSKQGWLQVFENALSAFRSREADMDMGDGSTLVNPIKALVCHSSNETTDLVGVSKTLIPETKSESTLVAKVRRRSRSNSATIPSSRPLERLPAAASISPSSSSTDKATGASTNMNKVRQQVSASTLDTLQRLQKRHRASYQSHDLGNTHRSFSAEPNLDSTESLTPTGSVLASSETTSMDPMHVSFLPTILDQSVQSGGYPWRSDSRCEMNVNSSNNESICQDQTRERDRNVLAAVLSTLRRFRDHVKSNLLHPDFAIEDSNTSYLAGLGFEGDLGIEWATTGRGAPLSISVLDNNSTHNRRWSSAAAATAAAVYHTAATQPLSLSFSSSSSSIFSSRPNVRRTSSDCGLESLAHERNGASIGAFTT
ncbi:hypothetical protein EDD11_004162 [Mortierella claussenii]|nr:hypothetical protein EDD11_004162 [Mortierella claussenii]